jgi:hypothetical protein
MAMADLARRLPGRPNDLLVLDVREAGFALEAST